MHKIKLKLKKIHIIIKLYKTVKANISSKLEIDYKIQVLSISILLLSFANDLISQIIEISEDISIHKKHKHNTFYTT